MLVSSREENVSSLGAAVQHNFRRTLLLPSREENINILGAAVQHNFRRTLLVPSREENIKRDPQTSRFQVRITGMSHLSGYRMIEIIDC